MVSISSAPMATVEISGSTSVYGVVGDPVDHSLSPALFNAAFAAAGIDAAYLAFRIRSGSAKNALMAARLLGLQGLSVTMPLKEEIFEAVDSTSDQASLLHAVNCVHLGESRFTGHNTDGDGFVAALRAEAHFDPKGKTAVVLGAGGAARAVVVALAGAGCRVRVINRTKERAQDAADMAAEGMAAQGMVTAGMVTLGEPTDVASADLLVNATSVGMGVVEGSIEPLPIDAKLLSDRHLVADLVYRPVRTPLLIQASQAGARTMDGVAMLAYQAGLQFEIFTGIEAPVPAMLSAARQQLLRG